MSGMYCSVYSLLLRFGRVWGCGFAWPRLLEFALRWRRTGDVVKALAVVLPRHLCFEEHAETCATRPPATGRVGWRFRTSLPAVVVVVTVVVVVAVTVVLVLVIVVVVAVVVVAV